MSGFALIFDPNTPISATPPQFTDFLKTVKSYKSLNKTEQIVTGGHFIAAKLDSPVTLHHGIISDEETGSWLLAVGTVIDSAAICSDGNLKQLLTDFLKNGSKVLERLDGHFALVIYDGRKNCVAIVSDPLGIISIFYGQKDGRFFISTSALAIAKTIQSDPDDLGVHYFILHGTVRGETTLWQNVKRLLPATVLKLSQNGPEQSVYWSFKVDQTVANLSLNEAIDCVINVLSEMMRHGLEREKKSWLSLTGGFDSRALAAMANHSGLLFKSYCHGQPDARDVHIASTISKKMGWDYEYIPLPKDWGRQRSQWLSETLGRSDAHLDVLKTSRIVREQAQKAKQFSVSLWGFGGETYRGYQWKQEFFNVGKTTKVNYDRLLDYRIIPTTGWPLLKNSDQWANTIRETLKTDLKAIGEQESNWLNTVKLDTVGMYLEHAWGGAHISTVLGLQRAIAPFTFKEGLSCVLSTNYKWRTRDKLFRLILERVNLELANIETADGGPALPMRVTNAYKFLPYWLNMGEKLTWSVTYKLLGRKLWNKRDAGPAGSAYPLGQWRRDTLASLEDKDLLIPEKMHSANLYDIKQLRNFLVKAQHDDFAYEGLLSRVITLEMALRSVGTSI